MEERGLKISITKTEYFGCNEHQDSEIHLQGEPVKTFTYIPVTWDRHWRRTDNWTRKSPTECRAGGRTGRECLQCCATGE